MKKKTGQFLKHLHKFFYKFVSKINLTGLGKKQSKFLVGFGALGVTLVLGSVFLLSGVVSNSNRLASSFSPEKVGLGEGVAACFSSSGPTCAADNKISIPITWDECGHSIFSPSTVQIVVQDPYNQLARLDNQPCSGSATLTFPTSVHNAYGIWIVGEQDDVRHEGSPAYSFNGPNNNCAPSVPITTNISVTPPNRCFVAPGNKCNVTLYWDVTGALSNTAQQAGADYLGNIIEPVSTPSRQFWYGRVGRTLSEGGHIFRVVAAPEIGVWSVFPNLVYFVYAPAGTLNTTNCAIQPGASTCTFYSSWVTNSTPDGVRVTFTPQGGSEFNMLNNWSPSTYSNWPGYWSAGTHTVKLYDTASGALLDSKQVVITAPTWTNYCTGGPATDPNGNYWQWWRYTDSVPGGRVHQFIRSGDGSCVPSRPTNVRAQCHADSRHVNIYWDAPAGVDPNKYHLRINGGINQSQCTATPSPNWTWDTNYGGYCYAAYWSGTAVSTFPITPNTSYGFWLHAQAPNSATNGAAGAWGEAGGVTFSCDTGTIRGYKVGAVNTGASFNALGISPTISGAGQTAADTNPYYIYEVPVGSQTVTSSQPAGYTVSYSTNEGVSWRAGTGVTVNVPKGPVDLWWRYVATGGIAVNFQGKGCILPADGSGCDITSYWKVTGLPAGETTVDLNVAGPTALTNLIKGLPSTLAMEDDTIAVKEYRGVSGIVRRVIDFAGSMVAALRGGLPTTQLAASPYTYRVTVSGTYNLQLQRIVTGDPLGTALALVACPPNYTIEIDVNGIEHCVAPNTGTGACPVPPLGNACTATTANSCGMTASTIADDGLGNGVGSCKCLPVPNTDCSPPTATLRANPSLINSGQQCNLEWQVTAPIPTPSTVSCTLTGSGLPSTTCTGTNCSIPKVTQTPTLTSTSIYTLKCKNGSGPVDTKTAKCTINPVIIER